VQIVPNVRLHSAFAVRFSGWESTGSPEHLAPVALANPTPEIMPEQACRYAFIMATDRSDYPNQYGRFLIAVFDEWVRHDVRRVFL